MLYTEGVEVDEEVSTSLKLVTVDELLQRNLEKVIEELNEEAWVAFRQGRLNFVYYLPRIMWDTKEVMDKITGYMEEAGWSFKEISNFEYEGIKKKKITFQICEEE